ncbi:MAG: potassium channel family protein [Acidimicrobiales bacterium]
MDVSRRHETSRKLQIGVFGLFLVLLGGTGGYVAFGYGILDAAFQTVITVTTVGFGEVHRFGAGEKVFTIVLILFGVGMAAYTFSVLVETFVEGYLSDTLGRRKMQNQIRSMSNHIIICGWGRVGRAIARHLEREHSGMVVIDISAERVSAIDMPYVQGDATDEEVLRAAGIDRARVLVTALNADADNLYVTLTARSMCPKLFIVARAGCTPAVTKLMQAGADRVVDPQDLGGARMAALAVQPHVAEFLDVVMHNSNLEFRLEQIEVPVGSPLAGQTLSSARIHDRTGILVLAMREPGREFRTNPSSQAEIVGGEVLIVIGGTDQVASLKELVSGKEPLNSIPTTS